MTRKYISCKETAVLVRQALKEAFKGIKFSVKSRSYSMGASIDVRWTDGPNDAQVEAVISRFQGSYFDGMQDYKGNCYHMMDGQQVSFGADSIHTGRDYSETAVARAINRVFARFAGNFARDGIQKPTVDDYKNGRLYTMQLSGLHHFGNQSVQHEIRRVMCKHSDRLKIDHSPTAAKVFQTHTDGHGQSSFDTHGRDRSARASPANRMQRLASYAPVLSQPGNMDQRA